jgi:F420-dependent oxidoreductase-like protein
MRISAKLAPTFAYIELEKFWKAADELGFDGIYNYDHFYGLGDAEEQWVNPTFEAWTSLAAMAAVTSRARVGCMVSSVTYRAPQMLAKLVATLDHISGGRLDIGLGAGWHQPEHIAYGYDYPSAGTRIAMLEESITIMKSLWTAPKTSFQGEFWKLEDVIAEPKPMQQPYPRIIIGGNGREKTFRVIAKHADEWNCVGTDPATFRELSEVLDQRCSEIGRDPSTLSRGAQMFLHPANPDQVTESLARIPELRDAGCTHVVLSFYQPPSLEQLQRCAPGELLI